MRIVVLLVFVGFFWNIQGQTTEGTNEKYPVFPSCKNVTYAFQKDCFMQTLKQTVVNTFQEPEDVQQENYEGDVKILFEVTAEGNFKVLYVEGYSEEIKKEVKRVFENLPKLEPGTHNGISTYMQFKLTLQLPISKSTGTLHFLEEKESIDSTKLEYDAVSKKKQKFERRQFSSQLNIPFSHEVYSRFDAEMNKVGTNAHTSVKPFLYSEVEPYYNFKEEIDQVKFNEKTWFGRKFFNEHLVRFQAEDYWFTADIAADLQIGKDFDADFNTTYNNTRAAVVQGGLGKSFNFYAAVYESQGRFAQYFNQYARSIKPDGGNPAIIPGRGIAKEFNGDFDYPTAEGYISYSPSKYFNFQFGHGKNFIGDGYRSVLMSDVASSYPYFKITTNFWKIKYTNTWMSLRDVRPEVTEDGSFRTKYMATHYLSYNVSKRLNIGLYEAVLWENDNDRGFDLNYLNPIIFYRAIEFSTGSRGGNAFIGLSFKYKWSDHFNMYGQLAIDEFSSINVFNGDGSYKNKQAFQLGFKYFDAFKVDNLQLQLEYNQARPYTYAHNTVILNYGHSNQSLAHIWGANFREMIALVRYKKNRIYGHAKIMYGERGYELTEDKDPFYGGDIYGTEDNRVADLGNKIGQGNKANFFYGELEVGFLVNPVTNLKVYGSLIYRDLNPTVENTPIPFQKHTTWVNFGLRTDLFNWYYDF